MSVGNSPIDARLAADFLGEWEDAGHAVEGCLRQLARHPADPDALRALYRQLHSMKSNLRMMEFAPGSHLLHALEDLVEAARAGRLDLSPPLLDLVRTLIAQVGERSEQQLRGQDPPWAPLLRLLPELRALADQPGPLAARGARHLLTLLDPEHAADYAVPAAQREEELGLFRKLAAVADARLQRLPGSGERIEQRVLELNRLAGEPVDALQLRVATLLHDVCLARNPGREDGASSHADQAAALLDKLPHWREAAAMIRQHHERFDGQGEPLGLVGAAIEPGAALLALSDTIDLLEQEAAAARLPRPAVHVLGGIHAASGTRLDPFWVEVFNRWMRQQLGIAH